MRERSPDIPNKLKQFLDEVATIDVRAEYKAALHVIWDQPEGKRVLLAWISAGGEVSTNCYADVDRDLAED